MTTKKSSASISKHKTTTTRKPASKSPQAFDIIPRSQVRPQSSARPVIMSSQPQVADNTLTAPSAAPTLQLKHRTLSVKPPKDSDFVKKDEASAPKEAGVSVAELIAKRSEKAKAESVPKANDDSGGKATEDELKKALEEPLTGEPTPATDTDEPKLPPVEPVAEVEKTADVEAVPQDATDPVTDDPKPADDKNQTDIEDNESLQKVLNGSSGNTNESSQPQEHSQALKDAMKDMNENGERPHHELYGGKPVIVVHKDHGMSGLAWVLWFLVCVGLALLIVNFMLDADIIQTTYNVPHTNLL